MKYIYTFEQISFKEASQGEKPVFIDADNKIVIINK